MALVRWEKQEKAPAAKRLDGGCNEWSDSGTVCGHWPSFREPTCEWSKGGGQRAVRHERRWTAHVEVEGWRVFLLFPAKTMTARSALHEATALIARAKRRQIDKVSRSPQRPAGEPNTAAGGFLAFAWRHGRQGLKRQWRLP